MWRRCDQTLHHTASTSHRSHLTPALTLRPCAARYPTCDLPFSTRRRHRRPSPLASTASDGEGESVDIDELAKRLSAEAERLRKAEKEVGSGGDADEALEGASGGLESSSAGLASSSGDALAQLPGGSTGQGPFGYASKARQAEVLAEVGDGGFYATDLELLQELGRIAVQQVSPAGEPGAAGLLGLSGSTATTATAVIAYRAKYSSGRPYEGPLTVFVKEYLPCASAAACNELLVCQRLTGMPENKWRAAAAQPSDDLPVVPLLGYILAGQSDSALEAQAAGEAGDAAGDDGDALWLVFKWEGLLPLSSYPSAPQPEPSSGGLAFLFGPRPAPDADLQQQRRRAMLRRIMAGCLRCLAYCHGLGVVHGSLGPASFLLSTYDDSRAEDLRVKLADWGFARMVARGPGAGAALGSSGLDPQLLSPEDDAVSLGQKEDLSAAALTLLQTACAALADGGSSNNTMTGDALQRLLCGVFGGDVMQFRQYCGEEPALAAVVEFLDEADGGGWEVVAAAMAGAPAAELLDHRFFTAVQR